MKTLDREELLERARQKVADFHRYQELGLVCKGGDFYPSVHYPPITMYPPVTEEELFETYTMPAEWVLACDGARSNIRTLRGLRLKGENFEGRYVIADVQMDHNYPTIRRALFDQKNLVQCAYDLMA